MKNNLIEQKKSIFLIIFYFFGLIVGFIIFKDYGIHIEEKYHRLNGHYWLNYISKIFNLSELQSITEYKISKIYDYTLSQVSYYNKWGVIFDVPVAFLEILLNLEKINEIYYFKHLLSYVVFLTGSFFFFKILELRYKNFYLSFLGLILYLTTPRIFGDSFLYKDTLFLSIFTITLFFFLKSIINLNYTNLILFSLFSALSFNLKIFTILIPIIFSIILIIQNFFNKKNLFFLNKFLFYLLFFLTFTFIFWPYLWESPIKNFVELFASARKDLIDVRILYFNEYIQNTLLPSSYLINWLFISSPIFQNLLFILGFVSCGSRIVRRLISIENKMDFHDLWRGEKEKVDFIFFFIFISFLLFFLVLNAPFYNGWRLVYFFNFFVIFFAVNFLFYLKLIFKKRKLYKIFSISIFLILISYNSFNLISYHPFQSIYFNNFLTKNIINGFEGDYYGISTKHFFNKILEIDKRKKIKIAVASHTPLQRGLEAFPVNIQKRFEIVGQEYVIADYIYKNNISEVNINLNKKYEIPKNFSKIYEFNIKKLLIYEIYKLKS